MSLKKHKFNIIIKLLSFLKIQERILNDYILTFSILGYLFIKILYLFYEF